MPGGNGTGPADSSSRTGEVQGRGGRGQGGASGAGPGGNCVCPSCGATVAHQAGVPCYQVSCPKCGTRMVRQ